MGTWCMAAAAVLVTLLMASGCGSGSGDEGPSEIETSFSSSVENASEAQALLAELRTTPHIFDYSPSALRTLNYLVDEQDLAPLSAPALTRLANELVQARTTLQATAEFQDLLDAKRALTAARDDIDRTFTTASATQQAFVSDWVDLLRAGEKEAGSAEDVAALLRAEQDLAEQAKVALVTGETAKIQVLHATVTILKNRAVTSQTLVGRFDQQKQAVCDRLERDNELESLLQIAQEFCDSPGRPAPGLGQEESASSESRGTRLPDAGLSYSSPVSTQGIGPILVGMSINEAERAGRVDFIFDAGRNPDCEYATTDSVHGVSFMVVQGTVARVDVETPRVSTLSGVRVGDSKAAVLAKYGGQIQQTPHEYYEDGSYLTYTPDDPDDETRVIFETDDHSMVSHIRAGRLPEVAYVEGCA